MKKEIYYTLIVLMLLGATSILVIYYLQPFNEDFNFLDNIDYAKINLQTYPDYTNPEISILQSATTEVGNLELENDGVFSKKYTFPQLFGCLELSSRGKESSIKDRVGVQISLTDKESGNQDYYYYSGQRKIVVDTNENKELTITATYSPGLTLSEFSRENLRGITIYRKSQPGENPININYDYNYNYYGNECTNTDDYERLGFIAIE